MDKFFEASSLPEDLIAFIRRNMKDNWNGNFTYVNFPTYYRSKLEKLLPEIKKYYGAKGWNVSLEAKDYYNRDQVRLNFYTARGGTLYF